jgi:hypothetical protein
MASAKVPLVIHTVAVTAKDGGPAMTEHPILLWPLLVQGSDIQTYGSRYGCGYGFSTDGCGWGDGTDSGDGNGFGGGSAGNSHGDGFGRSAYSNE